MVSITNETCCRGRNLAAGTDFKASKNDKTAIEENIEQVNVSFVSFMGKNILFLISKFTIIKRVKDKV